MGGGASLGNCTVGFADDAVEGGTDKYLNEEGCDVGIDCVDGADEYKRSEGY